MAAIFGHGEMLRALLQRWPEQVTEVYEGTEYTGENCLHIAIVNRNMGMVRQLLALDKRVQLGEHS